MAEGLGKSLKNAPQLDLPHAFLEHLGDLSVHLFRDGGGLLHDAHLEGGLPLSQGFRQGRHVDQLSVA